MHIILGKVGLFMNIEFHYYMTKYLALNAGFEEDEAEIIAYSSQFTDDNFLQLNILTDNDTTYQNYVSQVADITNPPLKKLRIHMLYHYFPGDPVSPKSRRRDGKMHLLMTTPGSSIAQDVFYSVNQNDNLYALGIASHMLADTFSHQNFIGFYDEMNSLNGIWEKLNPCVGHQSAGFKPDIPNLNWYDPRLIQENELISNFERVMQAAKKLYTNYLFITSMPNKWGVVRKNLEKILLPEINETQMNEVLQQQEFRVQQYLKLSEEMEDEYNPNSWLNAAVTEKVDFMQDRNPDSMDRITSLHAKENFKRSHWFKFQEAIKEYEKVATRKLEPLLEQLEIREW
jgi:hypothetical protein